MPIYKKNEEVLGYVIGEKVYCEDCWEKEKPKDSGTPIKVKDLKKNRYVCDSCGGTLPVSYGFRLAKEIQDPKVLEEYKRKSDPTRK
jgi:transposase-like protein